MTTKKSEALAQLQGSYAAVLAVLEDLSTGSGSCINTQVTELRRIGAEDVAFRPALLQATSDVLRHLTAKVAVESEDVNFAVIRTAQVFTDYYTRQQVAEGGG